MCVVGIWVASVPREAEGASRGSHRIMFLCPSEDLFDSTAAFPILLMLKTFLHNTQEALDSFFSSFLSQSLYIGRVSQDS